MLHRLAALSLVLLAFGPATPAPASTALVDDGGRVFSVQAGSAGELFPQGSACATSDTVLALDVVEIDGAARRVLVPGTCNAEAEAAPSLVYEETSGALYLVWQSRAASGASRIFLSYLAGDSWSEILEVTEEPVILQGAPQILTTHDEITIGKPDGSLGKADRRILHVVWSEGEAASPTTLYAPIILVDGQFLGWIPAFPLDELPTGSVDASEVAASGSLRLSQPELISGVDEKSIIVGYFHSGLGRVVTVEVRQLPAILSSLAAEAARFTEETGSTLLNKPGGIESLAGQVGARIIELGLGVHISIRAYLGAQVEQVILEEALASPGPGIPLDRLAGTVGARIIELGSRVFGTDGLEKVYEDDRLSIVAVSSSGFDEMGEAAPDGPQHLLRFYAASSRPAPDLGSRSVSFLSSSSGENGLLCWQEGASQVRYRESEGNAWGPVRVLPLSPGFGHEQVQEILRERVQKR